MVVCNRCDKENQDHYRFCLGCGAELPRQAEQGLKSFKAPTPPTGTAIEENAESPSEEPVTCPKCGTHVPANFKFCGACGHGMHGGGSEVLSPLESGKAALVLIRPDGSEGEAFPLEGTTQVGRGAGALFSHDAYLSPEHATLAFSDGNLTLIDQGSLNGVYIRIPSETPTVLPEGAVFRIGQEVIQYTAAEEMKKGEAGEEIMGSPESDIIGRISMVVGQSVFGNSYPIGSSGLHLGRERGDIVFPDDGYVSGLHCRIYSENGQMHITDLGSSNGSYLRVATNEAILIKNGDLLLMGQQLFRAQY